MNTIESANEALNELKEEEWQQFRIRYPILVSRSKFIQFMKLFVRGDDTVRLVWENGFLKGYLKGLESMKGGVQRCTPPG